MEASHREQSDSSESSSRLDTLTLARQHREKQGTWEVEVSYGGEADLHRHLKKCDKNPGHINFIPVDHFGIEHLPAGCHDNDLVDLVRTMSDLTVRVSVNYVSDMRPETFPGSDKPYPCYSNRGEDMMRVGTGFVAVVDKYSSKNESDKTTPDKDDFDCDICECKDCLNSPAPKTQFANIIIYTAAHVVYDQLEGEHTTCHLFFDRGGRPELCSGVVTLNGMSNVWTNTKEDWCVMAFSTHDMSFADRLVKMVARYGILRESVKNKYRNIVPDRQVETDVEYVVERISLEDNPVPASWHTMTIIVSHPHGCSKQISIGNYTNSDKKQNDTFTYTTASCPGTSGAYVFIMRRYHVDFKEHHHAHCGSCPDSKDFNYCGVGIEQF